MKCLIPFAALLCLPLFVGCESNDADVDPAGVDPVGGGAVPIESGSGTALPDERAATLASATDVQGDEAFEGQVVFSVPDMTCPISCAPAVQSTLADVEGVSDVQTDVSAHTVTFKAGKGFNLAAAKQALAAAEFPVDSVQM